jgi:hypothetical protein
MPIWSRYATLVPIELRPGGFRATLLRIAAKPAAAELGGIYVSEFDGSSVLGYRNPNAGNGPPICTIGPVSYANGIAVDGKGNLIDPDGGTRTVIVFSGPEMCGPLVGSASDPSVQPADAASANAETGEIVVGNIFDTSGGGSISICHIPNCSSNLTNAGMYEVAGVALAKNGDCWASATDSAGTATLRTSKAVPVVVSRPRDS